jgi:hypothetical protein
VSLLNYLYLLPSYLPSLHLLLPKYS